MKKTLSFLKNYKLQSILAPLFKLIEAALELLVPIIVSSIVDKGINVATPDKQYILYMFLLMLGVGLVGFLFSVTAQYFAAVAAVGLSTDLKKALFKKIQSLPYYSLDKVGSSSLVTRMTSDATQVQNGVNMTLRLFLRSPVIVFGALIMACTISLKIALIFLGVIIVLSIVILTIMFKCIPLNKKAQERLDSITLSTRENLVGARVIRAFSKEDSEIKSYQEKNADLAKQQKHIGWINGLMNPLTYVILNAAIILVVYVGALNVNTGDLTQGNVIALYNYLSIILTELIKFATLIITINKAIACANRVESVLNIDENLKFSDEKNISSSYIEFNNVTLKYHESASPALKNISFKVNKGDTIGIIGGTGSGKTSLVNLLPHFYDVSEGSVSLEGNNVNSYDVNELRSKFGVVPQKAVLFKGTIRSNLTFRKKDATDEEIFEALKTAQGIDVVEKKEKGLDSDVEQNGQNFSGGQKQRLCIARALVGNPDILILDDSSSALDYATDAKLRKALKHLDYKPTVFIVSQRTSSIAHCDQIIVLDNGEMVGLGTHEELLKNCEVYQEIHYSQTKKEDR
jgi:ATP-binding cassette, subfamily B, multidrug efflux pump